MHPLISDQSIVSSWSLCTSHGTLEESQVRKRVVNQDEFVLVSEAREVVEAVEVEHKRYHGVNLGIHIDMETHGGIGDGEVEEFLIDAGSWNENGVSGGIHEASWHTWQENHIWRVNAMAVWKLVLSEMANSSNKLVLVCRVHIVGIGHNFVDPFHLSNEDIHSLVR